MSADAKVWYSTDTHQWHGLCDWETTIPCVSEMYLSAVLDSIEQKHGRLAWFIHVYPNGLTGLRGFVTYRTEE